MSAARACRRGAWSSGLALTREGMVYDAGVLIARVELQAAVTSLFVLSQS